MIQAKENAVYYRAFIVGKGSHEMHKPSEVTNYCLSRYHMSTRHGLLVGDIRVIASTDDGRTYELQVRDNEFTWSLEQIWKEVTNG